MDSEKGFTFNGYDIFNLIGNAFFALIIVSVSIIIPARVVEEEKLERVGFGLPFSFVVQDLRDDRTEIRSYSYPAWVTLGAPMEYATEWKPVVYVLDIGIVWGIFFILYKRMMSGKE